VSTTNGVLGVADLYTTYPTNGTFASQIYDTHLAAPVYSEMDWNADVPTGSSLLMKVRTGNQEDLSDAAPWTNVAAMAVGGYIDPGDYRYVQFQALLAPDSGGTRAPRLKDVVVKWPGPERFVDIAGAFTKGPDHGVFELSIDGKTLVRAVTIDMTIFKDIQSYKAIRRITSSLTAEIRPRNTGK
jgi:hypothetical protein